MPPHQEVIGYTVAATFEHQQSGRRVVLEIGGAADLGGLTPPALSAPRPLSPVPPALGFSVATEGCCMQGRLELGGARRHPAAGTHARICMHAHMHTHMHTRCGHTEGTCSLAQPGIQGKPDPEGARRRALVRASLHKNTAWLHKIAHTRCAPLRLSQLGLRGVPLAPFKKKYMLDSPVHKP